MEKNKKLILESITGLVNSSDLSVSDVVAYWQETGQLKTTAPEQSKKLSDITLLPSKKIVTPQNICVGMFMYEDGLIFPDGVHGNQITSVVGYVGKTGGLSVCLRQKYLPWSRDILDVGTFPGLSGKETTRRIVEKAHQVDKKAEAAQWCFDYVRDGVKQGEAFLPLLIEWGELRPAEQKINASLFALGATPVEGWYWSSTRLDYYHEGVMLFGHSYNDRCDKDEKHYSNYVRPVLEFKL